jgi:hypothetical protein
MIMPMRRTLEDILLDEGLLDEASLQKVRRYARHNGVCLVRAAVEHGHVDEERLAASLAERLRLPRVELDRESVDDDAMREVPYDLAEARRLLPLAIDRGRPRKTIRVAMADPLDFDATEEIEMSTGCFVEPLVVRAGEVADAVARHYRGVITKMIPRRPVFGATPASEMPDTTTQRHAVTDEASAEVAVHALADLLIERGVIDRESWLELLRGRVKEREGE